MGNMNSTFGLVNPWSLKSFVTPAPDSDSLDDDIFSLFLRTVRRVIEICSKAWEQTRARNASWSLGEKPVQTISQ